MITALSNHLWQSTVVAAAVAAAAFALRRHRAGVRHALWVVASLKFLVPFSLLVALGGAIGSTSTVASVPAMSTPTIAATVQTFTEPFSTSIAPDPVRDTTHASSLSAPAAIGTVWACGFLVVVVLRALGWRRIRAALAASTPVPIAGVDSEVETRSVSGLLEPGVVGIWRPVLLVPLGLETVLSAGQLQAVVAHEIHHIRRRDNLTSALHMVVEAIFWFHPIVWWIGARLIAERERACDEHVLDIGAAPDDYAEGILTVCRRYLESPLACVSGVTGSDLKSRISAILAHRVGARLSVARRVALAAAAAIGVAVPIAAGMVYGSVPGQTEQGLADTSSAGRFEAAAIRPCDPSTIPTGRGGRGAGAGSPATGGDDKGTVSPGRLYLHCQTVGFLIQQAYFGRVSQNPPLSGGPAWVAADRFDIEAVAAPDATDAAMRGPMLRSLLEERFHLKTHHATRARPIYVLRAAKGGFKLTPLPDGTCTPSFGVSPAKARCGVMSLRYGPTERVFAASGYTLPGFAEFLEDYVPLDRPVIDRTSISGLFDFQLRLEADGPPDQMLAAALQPRIGLALDATTGPADFVIIDHVDKPVGDQLATAAPSPSVSAPAAAARQKFDVASIRPCENGPVVPGARNGGAGPVFSPGLLVINCMTLEQMVFAAYVNNGDPLLNDEGRFVGQARPRDEKMFPKQIRGGPDWATTERFTIEAKARISTGLPGNQAPERKVLMGPMLRALLEDRFKLKIHRDEQGSVPMYALAVAKGGLKINPAGPDSCVPSDPNRTAPYRMDDEIATVRNGGKPVCGHGIMGGPVGPNEALVLNAQTMAGVAHFLSGIMDRHVIDKTGVDSQFVIYLEYAPDDMLPYDFHPTDTTDPPTAPSITQALKALGLELQPTTGPKGYLVIDSVQRPDSGAPASRAAGPGDGAA